MGNIRGKVSLVYSSLILTEKQQKDEDIGSVSDPNRRIGSFFNDLLDPGPYSEN